MQKRQTNKGNIKNIQMKRINIYIKDDETTEVVTLQEDYCDCFKRQVPLASSDDVIILKLDDSWLTSMS